jgi:hypothetical protein
LFTGTADEKQAAALVSQQRSPIVLEASADAVVKTLESVEKSLEN